jgi:hypothetical protein
MAQAGSNYTDVIVAVWHLVLLYAAVRFWQDGALRHLVLAGLAAGLGLSAKYSMLIGIVTIQPLLLLRLWRAGGAAGVLRGCAIFAAGTLAVPGYWLVRNWLVTGYPLYPYDLTPGGLHAVAGTPLDIVLEEGIAPAGRALAQLLVEPGRVLLFLFRDPGLGSLNGGLGLAFWAGGGPALAWCLIAALRRAAQRDWFPILFWGQAPFLALVFLFQVDVARLPYNMRLVIVLVPFGLLALGLALQALRDELPGAAVAVRAACVAAAALAVVHLAAVRLPGFDFSAALAERARNEETSSLRYLRHAPGDLASLSTAFDPLDYLTAGGPGWDVYMAADWHVFYTAPVFGSRIQNRVWNFLPKTRGDPDALLFHTGFAGRGERLYYVQGRITPADAASDARYELVSEHPPTRLWVARARLDEPATRARLVEYYRRRFGQDIERLRPLAGSLPDADALIVSTRAGHALKYLALTGALAVPVHLAPAGREGELARRLGRSTGGRFLSLAAALPGLSGRRIAEAVPAAGLPAVYMNETAP